MAKEWQITPRTHDDLLTQLLENRGVIDQSAFLKPDYQSLHDPQQLLHLPAMIARIQEAIKKQEKIGIFGDYDHDGTPAAALLAEGITACGGLVHHVYIPSRDEGYGLSKASIDRLAEKEIELLITVDCGITSKPEIDYAKTKGMSSLVIDHHVVQLDKYPDAAIVVNPKQEGDSYPFKELCACGLAFKVIQALGEATGKISPNQLKWYLDLVAISTVCDMVPLVEENRVLVHYGLKVLQQTKRPGLQELYRAAALDPATISSYTIGFVIGPRLNAPGRMETASLAYDLLVAKDQLEAERLAIQLNNLNHQRQEELDRVLKSAEEQVQEAKLHHKKVIVVMGDDWSDGVVGLVAGRMTDHYHRPSFVLAGRSDGLAKGSGRSIDGFHLVEALGECEEYLVKYGGHAKAAGLTLAREQLELFYDRLIQIADQRLQDEDLTPKIRIDTELRHDEIQLTTVDQLTQLEPHGLDNPKPTFLVTNLLVVQSRVIGQTGKHLKITFRAGDQQVEAVAFGLASRQADLPTGATVDAVCLLDSNTWQGRTTVQLKVIDWKVNTSLTSELVD